MYVYESKNKQNVPVVALETCERKNQQWEWERKLIHQLNDDECYRLLCCFFGWTKKIELRARGGSKDKNLIVEHQDTNIFLQSGVFGQENRFIHQLPIGPGDTLNTAMVMVQVCMRKHGFNDVNGFLNLLKTTVGKML